MAVVKTLAYHMGKKSLMLALGMLYAFQPVTRSTLPTISCQNELNHHLHEAGTAVLSDFALEQKF